MSPPLQTCCMSLGRLLCPFWAPVAIRESAHTCSLWSSEVGWGVGCSASTMLLAALPPGPRLAHPVPAWPGTEAWHLVLQLQHWLAI